MRILIVVPTLILTNFLSGCVTKDTLIPTPEQDMQAVYQQHMAGSGQGALYDQRSLVRRPMIEGDVVLSDYVRTEKDQLQARFKKIPNPSMFMFVAPHLASDANVPIPGYVTEFKMWPQDHYALPGEISDMTPNYGPN